MMLNLNVEFDFIVYSRKERKERKDFEEGRELSETTRSRNLPALKFLGTKID